MGAAANGNAARKKEVVEVEVEVAADLDLHKGHLSMLRLTCGFFFVFGLWVWSSLCWVRTAELLSPAAGIERHEIDPQAYRFAIHLNPWMTPEPPCLVAFVACIVGFITSLVWVLTFRSTEEKPDLRLRTSQSVTLMACLWIGLTHYALTADDLPESFNNHLFSTTKELLELGYLVFFGNFMMAMDMNIMPVVHIIRMVTALRFTQYGCTHHLSNQNSMHWREMLLTHFSPTPLAAYFYLIPEPLMRYFNMFVVTTTMFPGAVIYVLPDTMVRTLFVYLQVLTQVFFMLTRNGPVPALVKILMLLGCQIRDRPSSGMGRYGIVNNVFRLATISFYFRALWRVCGERVKSNFGSVVGNLLRDPTTIMLKYYNGDLVAELNKIDVKMEMRNYDIPGVLMYLVPVICWATLAGMLLRAAHQVVFTKSENRTKTWIGMLGKMFTFFLAVGLFTNKMGIALSFITKEADFRGYLPIDQYNIIAVSDVLAEDFAGWTFGHMHSYYVKPDYSDYIGTGNNRQTSTVEREVHFDYLRHTSEDLWYVIEAKYAPSYDINTPMRASWLYHPFLELSILPFFVAKTVSRSAKSHIEHIHLLTPEYMQWFNEIDETFLNEPQNLALRQYQNKLWMYDYAEGFNMLHGKRNQFPIGSSWRRRRQNYRYNDRHHVKGLYEYVYGNSGAGVVNMSSQTLKKLETGQKVDMDEVQFGNHDDHFYHQNGRISDYEMLNKVMRRFSTDEIVDFGVVSGVVMALMVVLYHHRSTAAEISRGKRKVD